MQRYWLATHWPHRIDLPRDTRHDRVWAKDGKEHIIRRMSVGDLVFIYETGGGKSLIRRTPDGNRTVLPCHDGRAGVIALVRVTADAEESGIGIEEYVDGSRTWWRWSATVEQVNTTGFLPRMDLNAAKGYELGYWRYSGLRELRPDEFERIRVAYVSTSDSHAAASAIQSVPTRFGPGGEGPEHLALKRAIAARPDVLLHEDGLQLYQMEFLFDSSDKCDVVLKDRNGCFVAVEIEVDCMEQEVVGPLQAMKYRALLAYHFDVPQTEVRAILVAHSVHGAVKERCDRHAVQVVEVIRDAVGSSELRSSAQLGVQ